MNQKLSMDQAREVVTFLMPERQRSGGAGCDGNHESGCKQRDFEGRSQTRRVEVKVLMNRGPAGGNGGYRRDTLVQNNKVSPIRFYGVSSWIEK